jgi:flagellar L-ring protein FlgH
MRAHALAVRALCGLAAAITLAGCGVLDARVKVDHTPVLPVPRGQEAPVVEVQMPGNGAIYQARQYRPLFEDHRARLVGDTLTVQIVERVSASARSTSTVDKTGGVQASLSAIPGVRPNSFANGRASANGSSASNFEGKGATENSNDFSGTITAVVRGVLPNAHLLIAGEKQIGVNANVDVLRFSGQVDPRNIQPGNSIPSASIANVRLEHRGRGQQAEAQAMGWLSRVFLNVLPL